MTMSTPTVGNLVVTADGKELGRVKEIAGSCFKIDAPMAPDYWLATDAISAADMGAVRLRLDKKSLDDIKLEESQVKGTPGHSGYHRHN